MTDKIGALFVALEEDMREDDARELMNAIIQFRHVLNVETYISDVNLWVAEERARRRYLDLLLKTLDKDDGH